MVSFLCHTRHSNRVGLTPSTINSCNRDLIENLLVSQSVKIFPAFYKTLNFIVAFAKPQHLPPIWKHSYTLFL